MQAFTSDSVTYHFHGTISGPEASKHFIEVEYPYLIPGVSRQAINHIVVADGEGMTVRYHNLLIRYADVEIAPDLGAGKVLEQPGLPAI